jgi:hypothetical protein
MSGDSKRGLLRVFFIAFILIAAWGLFKKIDLLRTKTYSREGLAMDTVVSVTIHSKKNPRRRPGYSTARSL